MAVISDYALWQTLQTSSEQILFMIAPSSLISEP